jgi:hypothetical protein
MHDMDDCGSCSALQVARAGPLAKQRLPDECRGMVGLLIYLNGPFGLSLNHQVMISLVEPAPDKEAPKPKPSRSGEALRIIEEYANDLREIIKKLRCLLN